MLGVLFSFLFFPIVVGIGIALIEAREDLGPHLEYRKWLRNHKRKLNEKS